MTNMTRVNKYKDLRDNIKTEVPINRNVIKEVENVNDDFLSFASKGTETDQVVSQRPTLEDTGVRNDAFDTRINILNQIRDFKSERDKRGPVESYSNKNEMTLMERLSLMSPKEDVEKAKKEMEIIEDQNRMSILERIQYIYQDSNLMEFYLKKIILGLGGLFVVLCVFLLIKIL